MRTLFDNITARLASIGGITITTVGAMTWAASQNASLTAGSSGASLTLGQGTNGGVTINAVGSGVISWSIATTEKMRLSPTNANLLIGGTTDISGTGGLKVYGTTVATSVTSGAFQVGNNVGFSGSSGGACFFGGSLTLPGPITISGTADVTIASTAASTGARAMQLANTGGSVYFGIQNAAADFFIGAAAYNTVIYSPSNPVYIRTSGITTNGNLTVNGTGTQTFAGTITVSGIGTNTFSGPLSIAGPITITSTADVVLMATQASTGAKSIQLGNTGGGAYFGVQNAAGDFFVGAGANNTVIYSPGNPVYVRTTALTTNGSLSVGGSIVAGLSGSAPSLSTNSTMTFELTSNTTLSVKVRGTDGTTRTGTLTLS